MKTLISNPRVIFPVLLLIVAVSSLSVAQQYTLTDLGTFPGGKGSSVLAINDVGQAVGTADVSTGIDHAFLWSSTTGLVDLGLLNQNDQFSTAYGLNNLGQVVGQSGTAAFLWTQGTMQDIGNLGGVGTVAYGINKSAQIVGASALPDNQPQHAFLWTATSGMTDLGTLGGGTSIAYAVNDSGQVVGMSYLSDNSTIHAFLWESGTGMQDLGTLGGVWSGAQAINKSGQVAGWSLTSSNAEVGFIWDAAHGMKSLGTSRSQATTIALGVNQSRQVVGESNFGGKTRGFLWSQATGLQNVNAFISPKNPFVTVAYAISNVGQIVGSGSNGHALLLTPAKQSQRSRP
jgi:probable HAF family extracellular repeat protein